jgi:hypothetical protein
LHAALQLQSNSSVAAHIQSQCLCRTATQKSNYTACCPNPITRLPPNSQFQSNDTAAARLQLPLLLLGSKVPIQSHSRGPIAAPIQAHCNCSPNPSTKLPNYSSYPSTMLVPLQLQAKHTAAAQQEPQSTTLPLPECSSNPSTLMLLHISSDPSTTPSNCNSNPSILLLPHWSSNPSTVLPPTSSSNRGILLPNCSSNPRNLLPNCSPNASQLPRSSSNPTTPPPPNCNSHPNTLLPTSLLLPSCSHFKPAAPQQLQPEHPPAQLQLQTVAQLQPQSKPAAQR